jgi:2',3'-cyclic-nucleotide 2'-phosphodiesterase (5'-nucleotidase family)
METGEMLGGLYKKSTYLEQYRKKQGPIIVVDSGDLLNEHIEIKESIQSSTRLKADLIARIYQYIGIDAINVGELDLALGLDYLKVLEKTYDIPFLSANLVDEANSPVFKRYIIKEINGKKIGIFGLMDDTPDMVAQLEDISGNKLLVMDLLQSAESVVKELKPKVDTIIAITHHHMGRNWVLARRVPGIDVIVGGHHKQKIEEPYKAGNTFIVQSGEKGQYQGMLEITFASDGSKTAENELVPLGPGISDDPQVKAMIEQYNDKVTSLYSSTKREEVEAPLASQVCATCHSEDFGIWQASDHARAFETLAKRSRQFNPDCLACHTTRFEQDGGFTMELQQPELRNVQCDACHGNSARHLKDPGSLPEQKPDRALCVKCHTDDRCPDFEMNYQEEWEKIRH